MIRLSSPVRMSAAVVLGLSGLALPGLVLADSNSASSNQPTTYQVVFSPLNGSHVSGTMTMVLEGKNLSISSQVAGLEPNEMHHQHLHGLADPTMAASCPTMADDTNHDGYISVVEGAASYGKIKASLSDPQTQFGTPPLAALFYPYAGTSPANAFPVADGNGNESYHQTITFDTAKAADAAAFAAVTPLTNQVVVLHGATVPGTVDGTDGLGDGGTSAPVYDDLVPVACGVVTQVSPTMATAPIAVPVATPTASPTPSMPTSPMPTMSMSMPSMSGSDMIAEMQFAVSLASINQTFTTSAIASWNQYVSSQSSLVGQAVARDNFTASFDSARDQAINQLYVARNALVDAYNRDGLTSTRDQFLTAFQSWLNQNVTALNAARDAVLVQ